VDSEELVQRVVVEQVDHFVADLLQHGGLALDD
jgi:hypothetical protein